MTLPAGASLRDHSQIAGIDELKIIDGRIRRLIDRVVRVLVDTDQRQAIEVRQIVVLLKRTVAYLWRGRRVSGQLGLTEGITAVTLGALESRRPSEGVRVLHANAGVVVVRRAIVARHTGLHLARRYEGIEVIPRARRTADEQTDGRSDRQKTNRCDRSCDRSLGL